jgi:hypothetical protein
MFYKGEQRERERDIKRVNDARQTLSLASKLVLFGAWMQLEAEEL